MIILDIAAPILLMYGLKTCTASNTSLLNNFEIVATALIALLFFGEKGPTHNRSSKDQYLLCPCAFHWRVAVYLDIRRTRNPDIHHGLCNHGSWLLDSSGVNSDTAQLLKRAFGRCPRGWCQCLNKIERKVELNRKVYLAESSYLCTQIQTLFNLNSKVR